MPQTFDEYVLDHVRLGDIYTGSLTIWLKHYGIESIEKRRGWSWRYGHIEKYGYSSREKAIAVGLKYAKLQLLKEKRRLQERTAEIEGILEKIV